jgi:DNA-binding MarR family transcriptional regulator
MSPSIFLPVVRELVRSYQAFELASARHIRELGLTPPQFDIIATLGNTPGMNCKELGEKTLITKGTLTGVLDRLTDKGLICRSTPPEDRRSIFICLTPAGEALFQQAFPAHLQFLENIFGRLQPTTLNDLQTSLQALRQAFEQEIEA